MKDNLFTAYMDYLRFMDSYNKPIEPDPQPPTLTAERKAEIEADMRAALDAYWKAEREEQRRRQV